MSRWSLRDSEARLASSVSRGRRDVPCFDRAEIDSLPWIIDRDPGRSLLGIVLLRPQSTPQLEQAHLQQCPLPEGRIGSQTLLRLPKKLFNLAKFVEVSRHEDGLVVHPI